MEQPAEAAWVPSGGEMDGRVVFGSPRLTLDSTHQRGVSSSPREGQGHRSMNTLMNTAINEIGAGPYQLIVVLVGGGVYAVEGSFLLMLSIVAKSLISRWGLSPFAAGAMASILFSGLLAGTISGGFACDHYGRRMPILVTYVGISAFTLMGIMVPGLLLLLVAKFLLGFCLGFGVPAANAIVAESCPPAQRSNIYCLTMVLFSLGQLYAATIVWFMSPTLQHKSMHWRAMLAWASLLPLALCALAWSYLRESPHWLMLQGRISESRAVLAEMLRYKQMDEDTSKYQDLAEAVEQNLVSPCAGHGGPGGTESSPLLRTASKYLSKGTFEQLRAEAHRLGAIFSPSFRLTTGIMLYVTFASNFAYYGMIYGLPDTLKRAYLEDEDGWSPAAGLFLSAIFEIPGVFVAMLLGMTIGRRKNMSFAFLGCAVALVATSSALLAHKITDTTGLFAVLFVKLFLATGYIIVYLYLLECYPTKFRATGLAFCMVLGRLGAAACPFVYDGLDFLLANDVYFFLITSAMMAFASVACCFLPYETKDVVLEEDAPPGSCTQLRKMSLPTRRRTFDGALLGSSREPNPRPQH